MLTSVVSAGYYLYVVMVMFMLVVAQFIDRGLARPGDAIALFADPSKAKRVLVFFCTGAVSQVEHGVNLLFLVETPAPLLDQESYWIYDAGAVWTSASVMVSVSPLGLAK